MQGNIVNFLLEMFYLNTIEQLFLFVEQLDQLEVCLPYSRLLAGIPILAVFQNLRWNSNKTSLSKKIRFKSMPLLHRLSMIEVQIDMRGCGIICLGKIDISLDNFPWMRGEKGLSLSKISISKMAASSHASCNTLVEGFF